MKRIKEWRINIDLYREHIACRLWFFLSSFNLFQLFLAFTAISQQNQAVLTNFQRFLCSFLLFFTILYNFSKKKKLFFSIFHSFSQCWTNFQYFYNFLSFFVIFLQLFTIFDYFSIFFFNFLSFFLQLFAIFHYLSYDFHLYYYFFSLFSSIFTYFHIFLPILIHINSFPPTLYSSNQVICTFFLQNK